MENVSVNKWVYRKKAIEIVFSGFLSVLCFKFYIWI